MREVLTVRVRIKETYEVHGQRGLARMILFDGEGEGSGFYGKILPGASIRNKCTMTESSNFPHGIC